MERPMHRGRRARESRSRRRGHGSSDATAEKTIEASVELPFVRESRNGSRPEELGEVLGKAVWDRARPPAEARAGSERPILGDDTEQMACAPRAAPHEVPPAGNRVHAEKAKQVLVIEIDALELVPYRAVVGVDHAGAWLVDDPVPSEQRSVGPVEVLPEAALAKWDLEGDLPAHARAHVVEGDARELLERRQGVELGAIRD